MTKDEIRSCINGMDANNLHLVSHGPDHFGMRLSPDLAQRVKDLVMAEYDGGGYVFYDPSFDELPF